MSRTRIASLIFAACVLTILPVQPAAQGQARYRITALNVPAALQGIVFAKDINEQGDVLGWISSERGTGGIIIGENGSRSVTIPGATYLQPNALAADGSMVGYLCHISGVCGAFHRDSRGRLKEVVVAGEWDATNARDISDNGIVVGDVLASVPGDRVSYGFEQYGRYMRLVQFPGARHTNVMAVNNLGFAVGFWGGDTGNGPFIVPPDGQIRPLPVPGNVSFSPEAINDRGVIAGSYSDSFSGRGGVVANGVLISIEYPAPPVLDYVDPATGTRERMPLGSWSTVVTGINNRNEIVGYTLGIYYSRGTIGDVQRAFSFRGTPIQ